MDDLKKYFRKKINAGYISLASILMALPLFVHISRNAIEELGYLGILIIGFAIVGILVLSGLGILYSIFTYFFYGLKYQKLKKELQSKNQFDSALLKIPSREIKIALLIFATLLLLNAYIIVEHTTLLEL